MVKLNRIYTRTGDDGTTGLVDGSRAPKHAARMEAIGAVDEANSALGFAVVALDDEANAAIGVAISAIGESALGKRLLTIQNDMFDLGADVATPGEVDGALRIVASQVERLETEIDAMNDELEPLKSFILPGGGQGAAQVHFARTIARRAERSVVTASREVSLNPLARIYLNRLSDHLFVLGRLLAKDEGGDVLWQPGATR